jgi:hypothetical protein
MMERSMARKGMFRVGGDYRHLRAAAGSAKNQPRLGLTLPLFMPGVAANDVNPPATTHYFAFVADAFYARSNLHDLIDPILEFSGSGIVYQNPALARKPPRTCLHLIFLANTV